MRLRVNSAADEVNADAAETAGMAAPGHAVEGFHRWLRKLQVVGMLMAMGVPLVGALWLALF